MKVFKTRMPKSFSILLLHSLLLKSLYLPIITAVKCMVDCFCCVNHKKKLLLSNWFDHVIEANLSFYELMKHSAINNNVDGIGVLFSHIVVVC